MISSELATEDQAMDMIARYDWSEHSENSDADDSERALSALLESHVRIPGGVEITIYELLRAATSSGDIDNILPRAAQDQLQRYGMRISDNRLILSNTSLELKRLVAGTPYEADLRGMLLRLPGADRYNNKVIKFNGVASKCISLPLAPIFEDTALNEDPYDVPF